MIDLNWFGFDLSAFLFVFVILNIVNVIIQTFKTIVTVNGTPLAAAAINAVTFAIYTIVVVFMNADGLGLFWKAIIIGIVNFIGVYIVKWWEAKTRKEKLWKVEATVIREKAEIVHQALTVAQIPHNYVFAGEYTIFNCYCATCEMSLLTKEVLNKHKAKYFVSESKNL